MPNNEDKEAEFECVGSPQQKGLVQSTQNLTFAAAEEGSECRAEEMQLQQLRHVAYFGELKGLQLAAAFRCFSPYGFPQDLLVLEKALRAVHTPYSAPHPPPGQRLLMMWKAANQQEGQVAQRYAVRRLVARSIQERDHCQGRRG